MDDPQPARSLGERLSGWVNDLGYVRKWLVLGAVIGVVAGVGAIVFVQALELCTRFFLGFLAGYTPSSPVGEGNAVGSATFVRPWALPLVVGLGGLLSGILVFRLAPEAEGHGTDAAISAVHHSPRGIRGRVTIVKIVASALTIGSGGSGGREGPTAQISAGFGSLLARKLNLSPTEARIAVTVGMGAGIGAIFRAPLGGAVLGAEILYRHDFEVEALIPSIIASITGFAIFGAVEGFTPIFGFLRGYHFSHPLELGYYVLIGLAAGVIGILYARSFYGFVRLFDRLPWKRALKPAVAGVLVGLIGLVLPGALGTGYGWVQRAMGPDLLEMSLWVVVALPFAKILSTSLSIGSGGSGGIFGPGMVIGGFLGAVAWRLLSPFAPQVPLSPAPFVVVGMIACFGGIAHAPLAVMLMVAEMTGSLELLPPAMLAVGVATLVVGDRTIYRSQLGSRHDSPAYRLRFGMPMLSSISMSGAMDPPRVVLPSDTTAPDALERLAAEGLEGAPVVDAAGAYIGVVTVGALAERADGATSGRLADPAWPTLPVESSLEDAIESMVSGQVNWVPVLDNDDRVAGVMGVGHLISEYRRAVDTSRRRLARAPRGASLIDEHVGEGSPFAGRAVAEAGWPPGTLLIAPNAATS